MIETFANICVAMKRWENGFKGYWKIGMKGTWCREIGHSGYDGYGKNGWYVWV